MICLTNAPEAPVCMTFILLFILNFTFLWCCLFLIRIGPILFVPIKWHVCNICALYLTHVLLLGFDPLPLTKWKWFFNLKKSNPNVSHFCIFLFFYCNWMSTEKYRFILHSILYGQMSNFLVSLKRHYH